MTIDKIEKLYDETFGDDCNEPISRSTKNLMRLSYNDGEEEGKKKGYWKGLTIGCLGTLSYMLFLEVRKSFKK